MAGSEFWFEKDCDIEDSTYTVFAEGNIMRFSPATDYNKNGDPGTPSEGGDVIFKKIVVYNEAGVVVAGINPDKQWLEDQAYEAAK